MKFFNMIIYKNISKIYEYFTHQKKYCNLVKGSFSHILLLILEGLNVGKQICPAKKLTL